VLLLKAVVQLVATNGTTISTLEMTMTWQYRLTSLLLVAYQMMMAVCSQLLPQVLEQLLSG
jgi:hypothetical protein